MNENSNKYAVAPELKSLTERTSLPWIGRGKHGKDVEMSLLASTNAQVKHRCSRARNRCLAMMMISDDGKWSVLTSTG